jgi:starvation-inducible DNA-binding protein
MKPEFAKKLDILLGSLQVYSNNLHAIHWSLEAKDFIPLHAYFGEIYDCTGAHVDMLAEFKRIYGGEPINTLKKYLLNSKVAEISGAQSKDRGAAIRKAISDTSIMNQLSVECFKASNDYPDVNDYMALIVADFGKRLWFLKSSQ